MCVDGWDRDIMFRHETIFSKLTNVYFVRVMLLYIDFNIFIFQVASQMAKYLIRQENTVYRFLSKLVMERLLKVTNFHHNHI